MVDGLFKCMGIEVESYDLFIGVGIVGFICLNIVLVWIESFGLVMMEVQDVLVIVVVVYVCGVLVVFDNIYMVGVYFDVFVYGVDISMQVLMKYVGGYSDLLFGLVLVNLEVMFECVGSVFVDFGMGVLFDDCSLVLCGL